MAIHDWHRGQFVVFLVALLILEAGAYALRRNVEARERERRKAVGALLELGSMNSKQQYVQVSSPPRLSPVSDHPAGGDTLHIPLGLRRLKDCTTSTDCDSVCHSDLRTRCQLRWFGSRRTDFVGPRLLGKETTSRASAYPFLIGQGFLAQRVAWRPPAWARPFGHATSRKAL